MLREPHGLKVAMLVIEWMQVQVDMPVCMSVHTPCSGLGPALPQI